MTFLPVLENQHSCIPDMTAFNWMKDDRIEASQQDFFASQLALLQAALPNEDADHYSVFLLQEPFDDPDCLDPLPLVPRRGASEDSTICDNADLLHLSSFIDLATAFGGRDDRAQKDARKRENADASTSSSSRTPETRTSPGHSSSTNDRVCRLRIRHDAQWQEQFQKLRRFKEAYGHCCVPITFEKDQLLARWVKRQRYQYKRNEQGKQANIDSARIQSLESIGFIWNTHAATWEQKFNELVAYQEARGHCHIPYQDPENIQLSIWAKCQRRQYKLFRLGRPSNMTVHRIEALQNLGFQWTLRSKASP